MGKTKPAFAGVPEAATETNPAVSARAIFQPF